MIPVSVERSIGQRRFVSALPASAWIRVSVDPGGFHREWSLGEGICDGSEGCLMEIRFGGPKGISKMRCCRKPNLTWFFHRTACGLHRTLSD
jgi:hypothetical protein